MSFTWIEDLVTIDNEDLNEIKTNIDAITTELGISAYSWSELPVADGAPIESVDVQELRNATDYIEDNKCPSDYTAHDDGYDATYDSGFLDNDHGTYKSGEDSGYDGSYNSGYLNGDHGTYYNNQNTTVYSTQDSGYDSTYKSGVLNDDHGTYNSGVDSPVDSADNAGYDSDFNSGVLNDLHGTYKTGENTTFYSIHKLGGY